MTPTTPPAVSEVMREAVARAMFEFDVSDLGPGWTWDNIGDGERSDWMRSAEAILAGPLASEIARLTGRFEEAMGIAHEALKSAEAAEVDVARLTAERDAALKDRVQTIRDREAVEDELRREAEDCGIWEDRAAAAEADLTRMRAETERLRAALEAAETRFTDIAAGRAFQPRLHAATGATEARAALSNPEQTDA